jgi:hypothetical protein
LLFNASPSNTGTTVKAPPVATTGIKSNFTKSNLAAAAIAATVKKNSPPLIIKKPLSKTTPTTAANGSKEKAKNAVAKITTIKTNHTAGSKTTSATAKAKAFSLALKAKALALKNASLTATTGTKKVLNTMG